MDIIQKAGCIILDKQAKTIGIVYRTKYADYTFAKGHLEIGESLKECALRETEEETGRLVEIIENIDLPLLTYVSKHQRHIEVKFFLAVDKGDSTKNFDENLKHDLIWVPFGLMETILLPKLIPYWRQIKHLVYQELHH